jgi:hypothetical protein
MAEVGGSLDGLVNNAGIGVPGPLEVLSADDLREQLEVNVIGQVAVTQAALPLLRAADGRIVFVGSVGGQLAAQFAGPYHASKFAIEAIADVWRQELEPEELAVIVIEPSAISTPIWDKAIERIDMLLRGRTRGSARYRERLSGFRDSLRSADEHGKAPDDVAETIETAPHRRQARHPLRRGSGRQAGDRAAFARPGSAGRQAGRTDLRRATLRGHGQDRALDRHRQAARGRLPVPLRGGQGPAVDDRAQQLRAAGRRRAREGSKFRENLEVSGQKIDAELEITAFDPPHRAESRTEIRGIDVISTYELTPSGSGTRLTQTIEASGGGLKGRVLIPVIQPHLEKKLDADLAALASLLND